MRTSPILALVSVLALAACGDEGPPSDAEHYAAATREVAAAWCGAVARCCDAAELAPIAAEFGFTSPEQCAGTFVAKAAAVEERLRAGQVQLDREAMAACQRELAAATCGQFAAIEATCARAVRGAIANGDACDDDGVCASGWCGEASEDSPRTCKAVPAVGEPCGTRCVAGAVCQPTGVGDPVCVATLADGAACQVDGQCSGGRCAGAIPAAGTAGVCASAPVCDGV
ncbi:MAG: hypothetical protein KBG48_32305 [Kofleriaceae bacterium]|jgi:hypothetical protein|nr:hypothetical protein [Kofleriaceae bacterium]MBP9172118.1 hypothetical protein [Kofleriaceae bacterium]MBP9859565.1 hypothetical protein [Kofleriaceae bacterium]